MKLLGESQAIGAGETNCIKKQQQRCGKAHILKML